MDGREWCRILADGRDTEEKAGARRRWRSSAGREAKARLDNQVMVNELIPAARSW